MTRVARAAWTTSSVMALRPLIFRMRPIWMSRRWSRRKLPPVMRAMEAMAWAQVEVGVVELEAEPAPVAGEHEAELVAGERAVVMGEAHAAVELGVAGEALLHAGHADQDDAHAGAVEAVADELEPRRREALGLVEDQQLHEALPGHDPARLAPVVVIVDAGVGPVHVGLERLAQVAQRAHDGGGVEHGAGAIEDGAGRGCGRIAATGVLDQGLDLVPVGVAARGQGLAHPRGPEAQADGALPAHGGGELDEVAVFLGGDEGAFALGLRHGGHQSSSS